MKKTLLFLLSLPLLATSQWQNLKLENSQILFEKVYTIDSLDAVSIGKILSAGIPKTKDITIGIISSDLIPAKIKDAFIDYKKYGGKWASTPAFFNYPFSADVSIVWKDHKYKVSVTNMSFNTSLGVVKLSDVLTRKRGTELSTSKDAITSGEYIDKYLSDLFALNASNDTW